MTGEATGPSHALTTPYGSIIEAQERADLIAVATGQDTDVVQADGSWWVLVEDPSMFRDGTWSSGEDS